MPVQGQQSFSEFTARYVLVKLSRGPFTNYVDKILAFFDHLPPSVDIFYRMNVDKKGTFLDPFSCKRSLWTAPSSA